MNACAVQSSLNISYIPIRLIDAGADVNAIDEVSIMLAVCVSGFTTSV